MVGRPQNKDKRRESQNFMQRLGEVAKKPHDVLLDEMNDSKTDKATRREIAKHLLPFYLPKMASIEAQVDFTLSHEEALDMLDDEEDGDDGDGKAGL
jgi:hypothetical protein